KPQSGRPLKREATKLVPRAAWELRSTPATLSTKGLPPRHCGCVRACAQQKTDGCRRWPLAIFRLQRRNIPVLRDATAVRIRPSYSRNDRPHACRSAPTSSPCFEVALPAQIPRTREDFYRPSSQRPVRPTLDKVLRRPAGRRCLEFDLDLSAGYRRGSETRDREYSILQPGPLRRRRRDCAQGNRLLREGIPDRAPCLRPAGRTALQPHAGRQAGHRHRTIYQWDRLTGRCAPETFSQFPRCDRSSSYRPARLHRLKPALLQRRWLTTPRYVAPR